MHATLSMDTVAGAAPAAPATPVQSGEDRAVLAATDGGRTEAPGAKARRPLPLNPPATEAELNCAAEIWTAAQDVMVARGFARHLWGSSPAAAHEFVVLMLRGKYANQRPAPDTPFLFPLFEHMEREHGLTLVDSELEEIRHVCRQLDSLAAAQATTP